ncbi:MAG: GNAT family N-acetyltransferase [Bacteroidia bacterium]|jgi:ribosomal protein S18 acetylase RimI-like enzyme
MTIKRAISSDHLILTDITKKAKAYWGYSDEQMEKWSDILTITSDYIEKNSVYKLCIDTATIGYYSFFEPDEGTVELDNLFLFPDYIGSGLGRLLIVDFIERMKAANIKYIVLEAEPKAEGFYEKFGFVKVGQVESSIENRFLFKMKLKIAGY